MPTIQLSKQQARKIAIHCQFFNGFQDMPKGKEGIAKTIEQLGYVQIDTIAVVERAHHHTLWTRRLDYNAEMLHELQSSDRRIFEYWGHAASYLPMSDYRFYIPFMHSQRNPSSKWIKMRLEKHGHLMQPVLERIKKDGPLSSKDFEPPPGKKKTGWWDWKPAKVALELLFWRGEVMVSERNNFQKKYDLPERVLPDDVNMKIPDQNELGEFFIKRALTAYGIARNKDINEHINAVDKSVINKALKNMIENGAIERITIEDNKRFEYYVLTSMTDQLQNLKSIAEQVFILSPFDNFIILRDRIESLFDFQYSLECYLPPQKRNYGYFTLPILWGDELVGRFDPKADRKKKLFTVRNLVFEPNVKLDDKFLAAFSNKLRDFADFNQCDEIEIGEVSPVDLKPVILKFVGQV